MTRTCSRMLACTIGLHLAAFASAAAAAPQNLNNCKSITQSGPYVVTKNLTAVGDCLVVKADFVTIDLDGFVITGDGTGGGITDQGAFVTQGTTVRNGTVRNFDNGISLGASTAVTVERILSTRNNNVGILLVNGIVRNSIATENPGNTGISVGERSLVTGNVSTGNDVGIIANSGSTVSGNTVGLNVRHGILVYEGTVTNNTVRNNPQFGIRVECPSAVISNTASQNGVNLTLVGAGCASEHNAAP